MTSTAEIDRRDRAIRDALATEGVDALVVSGSEYTGFDGAVFYASGFQIVHRYAYVLIPLDGEAAIVWPSEARYVGEHDQTWIEERAFADTPGEWLRQRAEERGWRRLGVYGLDFVMNVRDYRALAAGALEIVPFDVPFDLARAVKSSEELESVRESVRVNEDGFWTVLEAYEPGKTEAEIMAPGAARFVELGTGRHAMNMVLAAGASGSARPEFVIPSETRPVEEDDLLLYSLEIAGPRRPLGRGVTADHAGGAEHGDRLDAGGVRRVQRGRAGHAAGRRHRARRPRRLLRAVQAPRLRARPRHRALDRYDDDRASRIGEGNETELRENMVLSMHPHVIAHDGSCLYMQETWRVGADGGEQLSTLPIAIFTGSERPLRVA